MRLVYFMENPLAPKLMEDYPKQPWAEMGNGLMLYYPK